MAISHCYWHLVVSNGNSTLFNSIRGQSDLFTVKCCHWDSKADIPPIQHYQRTEWSLHCSMLSLSTQRQIYTPFNTIRGQSDLFTVQCCHWDSKADIPPIQHYQRTEWSLHCSMLSLTLKGRYTPWSTLVEDRVISSLFNVVIDTQRQIYPPVQHYQRTEWSLHCSMLSLILKGRYTPHSTLSEDRVISSLFNVVIDTQRQIYPSVQHYQRTEWSLHCSMLSLILKGRYTPAHLSSSKSV